MMNKIYHEIIISIAFLFCFAACKKVNIEADSEEVVSPSTGTRTELTLDSIFLYAKQIYLWNDALPSYKDFNPRQRYSAFSPEIKAFNKELFDLSQLKLNLETGKAYEFSNYNNSPKYSFLQFGTSRSGAINAGSLALGEVILASKTIQSSNKTIGYIAIGSFPPLNDAKTKLNNAFDQLAATKPKYIIVDLRSNNGGYVETAEYVANLIVPSALNGKLMYTEQFNSTLQAGNGKILKHQPYLDNMGKAVSYKGRAATLADIDYSEKGNTYFFEKKGSLESVEEIYVIVSGQTASASELLISCLKPYFDIKLIGERTFGKPVGFFGINIDKYAVYLSSFLIRNAQGWSNYFNGIEPDVFVKGLVNPELGNVNELCLKAAITFISENEITKKTQSTKTTSLQSSVSSTIDETFVSFGMIENRLKLVN